MLVLETIAEVRTAVREWQRQGLSVGFVPTMGALHAGHVSLMERASADCDVGVASIFVNPTQFGPNEDLQKYPRPRDRDLALCEAAGMQLVFYPTVEMMYPSGHATTVDVADLANGYEGAIRPGHFRGVTTVVSKLFHIVPADRAYFGQKDYQQQTLIRQMVRDLDFPIEIIVCPTIRDADGLALSSRNAYLSPAERQTGLALSQALFLAEQKLRDGIRDPQTLQQLMRSRVVNTPGIQLDYAVIADPDSLRELTECQPRMVALIAGKVGNTRLLDNLLLNADEPRRGRFVPPAGNSP